MTEKPSIIMGVRRALALRCPKCGEGRLFGGFLRVKQCDICGADNTVYPADDAPPFVTLLLVGHLLIPLIWWVETTWHPEIWVHFAIGLPLVVAMTVAALPYVKGER
jgi:uncharacterized protein (DUF983 family)